MVMYINDMGMKHNSIVQTYPIIVHQILLITMVNHTRECAYIYFACITHVQNNIASYSDGDMCIIYESGFFFFYFHLPTWFSYTYIHIHR